jgi:hypothetical protein
MQMHKKRGMMPRKAFVSSTSLTLTGALPGRCCFFDLLLLLLLFCATGLRGDMTVLLLFTIAALSRYLRLKHVVMNGGQHCE